MGLVETETRLDGRLTKYERRLGLYAGGIAAVLTLSIVGVVEIAKTDAGRGTKITACPDDYEGVVKVTDSVALGGLGEIAELHGVLDPEASGVGSGLDIASVPGELACDSVVEYGNPGKTQVVLLPVGLEVLDRSTQGMITQRPLPDGLELVG